MHNGARRHRSAIEGAAAFNRDGSGPAPADRWKLEACSTLRFFDSLD